MINHKKLQVLVHKSIDRTNYDKQLLKILKEKYNVFRDDLLLMELNLKVIL